MPESSPKKALIVVSEDWYFMSHRQPLARALQQRGFEVSVACRFSQYREEIEAMGCSPLPLELERDKLSPRSALKTLKSLRQLYKGQQPDLVIHCTLLLSFLGCLASQFSSLRSINLITGLGYSFLAQGLKARIIRTIIKTAFRLFSHQHRHGIIVQNQDDHALFQQLGFTPDQTLHTIRGSGVDDQHFCPPSHPTEGLRVAFVARMLWAKGLGELIEATRLLKAQGILPDIQLIGEPDPANPQSATEADLKGWQAEGLVTLLGRRNDIAALYQHAHIAVLPSWREGMPKSLLEAAACGLPLVTTDVPGCRELVQHNHNGLLVPPHNPQALAEALAFLIENPDERQRMGKNARHEVETKLNERVIAQETVHVIENHLNA